MSLSVGCKGRRPYVFHQIVGFPGEIVPIPKIVFRDNAITGLGQPRRRTERKETGLISKTKNSQRAAHYWQISLPSLQN